MHEHRLLTREAAWMSLRHRAGRKPQSEKAAIARAIYITHFHEETAELENGPPAARDKVQVGQVRDGDVVTESRGEPRAVEVRDEENKEAGGRDGRALSLDSRTHEPTHVIETP